MIIKAKRICKDIPLPRFANPDDGAADLRSAEDLMIEPGCRALVKCGFAMELPQGCSALVIPRSGLAAKHGITVVNAPGLIDSGYRGEICVILLNTDKTEKFEISKGDRIAQIAIIKTETFELEETDELEASERGEGGFGSSGVK